MQYGVYIINGVYKSIEFTKKQTCISPEPRASAKRQWGRVAKCWLIIGTGCQVQFFSLILDSSVGLSAGIQSAGYSVPRDHLGSNPASSRGRQPVTFRFENRFLCQSIEINNNKQVYRQSHLRMPNGSGVEWVECSLITVTGCRVQLFLSMILDSSVDLSAGIQSTRYSVPSDLLGSNPAFRESLACARASKLTTDMYIINWVQWAQWGRTKVVRRKLIIQPTGFGAHSSTCF